MNDILIIHHDEAETADALGGKAAALRLLSGFNVPPWFVVTPAAAEVSRREPERVRLAIEAAAERLARPGMTFAVRSSAVVEDGAQHSFAGQFESYLRVPPAQLAEHVRRVWDSAASARVGIYMREREVGSGVEMAVLVQAMVEPRCAGIAFGIDPLTGDERVVISAVAGTAERLVSGEVSGVGASVDEAAGVALDPGAPEIGLDVALSQRIAELARAVSDRRGRPQDIEWAFDGRDLFLLQARPITTVGWGEITVWDNSNIAESYSGVTTPLTFSFARKAYEEVYRTFCRLMGVSGRIRGQRAEVFRHMLGSLEGRVYYNLMNWYRLIAMLPGYRVNGPFMEQMMGVRSGLPAPAKRALERELDGARTGSIRDGARLARSCVALLHHHATLPRRIRAFYAMLDASLADADEFAGMRPEQLVARYRVLEGRLLPGWDAPILNDFFAMIHVGLLHALCSRLTGDPATPLHNALLRDVGDVISIEPARRIERMASLARAAAREDPALLPALAGDRPEFALERLECHSELHEEFRSYLRDFGDRCLQELKLESPTLRDDPTPLLRSIGAMAQRGPDEGRRAVLPDAARELQAAFRGHPVLSLAVRFVLPRARARIRDRENLRFARTRVFGHIRRLFRALAERYAAVGLIDDPSDMFFLEVEEALGLTTGIATSSRPRELVAARRREYDRQCASPPLPSRFETRGPVNPLRPIMRPAPAQAGGPEDGLLRGIGCCPGIVRGRARVVREPSSLRLDPHEIIIAERTDPGWVLLFPAAAGIAVEHGGILSHTSIVARELGLPCVVAVPGLLARVHDGDRLELDGAAGTIRTLGAEP